MLDKKQVEEIGDSKFNYKERVIGKINQLNDSGSNEGFILSFELMGLAINSEDEICIKKRNRFLHGSMPFETEGKKNIEIKQIALRIHSLVCSLILKYAGCTGYVKNNLKYFELINSKNKLNEPLFKKL